MAQLVNPTFTGNPQDFLDAFEAALSSSYNLEQDDKNILPVVYQILSEKYAEADRMISASKNDNYLSIPIKDEAILRSKNTGDKLLYENAFKIDRIGITSSAQLYSETQYLAKGTTIILLSNVPSDTLNITITFLNDPTLSFNAGVLLFNETSNTIVVESLKASGVYKIVYTTTGDVFDYTETKSFFSSPSTQVQLTFTNIVFGSEKIHPLGESDFKRDQDYVFNYVDGILDFTNSSLIANKQIIFIYKYRRDLLKDAILKSHVSVVNEVAIPNLDNASVLYVRNQPIQDITRIQNITTQETYTWTSVSNNEIQISGINLPKRTSTIQDITIKEKTLDFANERESIQAILNYPSEIAVLNHPLVKVDDLQSETKNIRLSTANQIITSKDSTLYRRIRQEVTFLENSTSVVLDFNPVNFVEVIIYKKSDLSQTNLITPVAYSSVTRIFQFTGTITADDYIVKYDTLEWIVYIGKDVSDITIKTGGVLLRNAFRKLLINDDYTFSLDDATTMRVAFTLSGASKVGNASSFYTLFRGSQNFDDVELVNNEQYEFSYHQFLKNESVAFTEDPLDQIDLVKLERFRDKGQTTDIIINPVVLVFSLDGGVQYTEDIHFTIDYINRLIKRTDVVDGIIANQAVTIFYEDVCITKAGFTYVEDIIQVDYEYGDNTIDFSPSITDSPTTQLEALRQGATEIILQDYPADWEQVQIIDTLVPEDKTTIRSNGFDPNTKLLNFTPILEDSTYQFSYDKRDQPINQGIVYYVSYRYGSRRDTLQDHWAYLLNLDVGQVIREDEYPLASDQISQVLDYLPVDFTKVKIYAKDDTTKTLVTKIRTYSFLTNTITFDVIEDAGIYVFEYYTFRRNVEQLRKGVIGLLKAIPNGPTKEAFRLLIREYVSTDPIIENISDQRFQIKRRITLTKEANPGDSDLFVTSVFDLPRSGTAIIYDQNTEIITYAFISSGKLRGIPSVGFGSITKSHSVNVKVVVLEDPGISYTLNPTPAKEAPDLSDGSRAIQFVASKFNEGLLCQTTRKAYVNYRAENNINTDEGTISFWTGTKYDGNDNNSHYYIDVVKHSKNKNRLSIYKNNKGYLVFEVRDSNGRLMSIRIDVRRKIFTESLSLTAGTTEIVLAEVPAFAFVKDSDKFFEAYDNAFIAGLSDGYGDIIPGTEIELVDYDREESKLIIKPISETGIYFFSYITGFVNFDETEHFIEATWKIHVRDGQAARMKLFLDGIKYERIPL